MKCYKITKAPSVVKCFLGFWWWRDFWVFSRNFFSFDSKWHVHPTTVKSELIKWSCVENIIWPKKFAKVSGYMLRNKMGVHSVIKELIKYILDFFDLLLSMSRTSKGYCRPNQIESFHYTARVHLICLKPLARPATTFGGYPFPKLWPKMYAGFPKKTWIFNVFKYLEDFNALDISSSAHTFCDFLHTWKAYFCVVIDKCSVERTNLQLI